VRTIKALPLPIDRETDLKRLISMLIWVDTPVRWTNPSTWPWVVYAWLAILLAGQVKPAWWRWFKRRQAAGWPGTQARIESVNVAPKEKSFWSASSQSQLPAFVAALNYSYSAGGQTYSGRYERQFGTEAEGREFVRDLQGKPAVVSYNPRNPSKSTLSEDAVAMLLSTRAPTPAGTVFEPPVSDLPVWMRPLLWPFIALSTAGLALSLWIHLGAVAGRKVAPGAFFIMMHLGIFIVWIPAVLVANKRTGTMNRKDFWKAMLKGSPEWMRYMVYGFFWYAVVNFVIFLFQTPKNNNVGVDPPVVVWRGFSGHWMAFYSAALAILYSAANATNAGDNTRGNAGRLST
jgi:uncharacterized protein DUF3592